MTVKPALLLVLAAALAACVPATQGGLTMDRNWTERYEKGEAYYNLGDRVVTVFADPTLGDPVHLFGVGRGGFLDACVQGQPVCRITYGEEGAKGWVDMTPFKTNPDTAA